MGNCGYIIYMWAVFLWILKFVINIKNKLIYLIFLSFHNSFFFVTIGQVSSIYALIALLQVQNANLIFLSRI